MNHLLFPADDWELDDFGCCGGKLFTPNRDRVARGGLWLRRYYCSAALCALSRWEYLAGQSARHCRPAHWLQENPIGDVAWFRWNTHLQGTTPTVAHHLAARGYRCRFFGTWHTGPSLAGLALATGAKTYRVELSAQP